jgi:hypothetical protein
MGNRNLSSILEDIRYWIKAHWFLCFVIIGFLILWRASGTSLRNALTGEVYPSLILLTPLLIICLLSFIVIIYSDMAT